MSKQISKEKFIELAKKIHGDKYDYSKVEYKNKNTKVCIICPIHGEFWQQPRYHLKGQNCFKCSQKLKADKVPKLTLENFIKKARIIHGDKYNYSKDKYKNNKKKVYIICSITEKF